MGKKRKRPAKEATRSAPASKKARLDTIHHPVLSRYYRRLLPLRQYVLDQLPASSKARRRRIAELGRDHGVDIDPGVRQLADLLDSTLVGILEESDQEVMEARQRDFVHFTQSQERSLLSSGRGVVKGAATVQSDIVEWVIKTLFDRVLNKRSQQRPQHVLANGFERATGWPQDVDAMGCNIPGIRAVFPNPQVTVLKQAPWTSLLGLLGKDGEDIMVRLLLDCGIFTCVDAQRGVYRQLSGTYLTTLDTKPLTSPAKNESRPEIDNNNYNDAENGNCRQAVSRKLNSIVFVRRRMLYGRPALNSRGEVKYGLRHIHVLNRFPSPEDEQHTVHVMKYIFPRQFGLHNVFTSTVDHRETSQPFKDYTMREDEIRKSPQSLKLPKRLRGQPLQLVRALQKRNKSCPYTELLRYYCPLDEVGPPRLVSESFQDLTPQTPRAAQLPYAQSHGKSVPEGLSQSAPPARTSDAHVTKQKVCLMDYATPAASVSAFCRAVLRRLLPKDCFGVGEDGAANWRTVMRFLDLFIRLGRFESLSLHQVCQGLKVTCIPWLEIPHSRPGDKISLTDLNKRVEILQEFVYYLFDSLLIPLIRAHFYVTESQVHRNRLFFFRHDVWRRLTERPLVEMKSSLFVEVKRKRAQRILARKRLPWTYVRLLPKASGVRPITNLRRRATQPKGKGSRTFLGASINSMMAPVYSVLNFERSRRPDLFGSSLFSVDEIYQRLRAFKKRVRGQRPPFYFVKLDIEHCFDTIPQRRLLDLAKKLVSETAYTISKHVEIRPGSRQNNMSHCEKDDPQGKPWRKFLTKASPTDSICSLTDSTNIKSNAVYVDLATVYNQSAQELFARLDEHVRANLVKIGKKFFKQREGIPQGSILSSLLCNYFYGALEREVLGFLSSGDALLLRFIDDFLLVTPDAGLARRFLQLMIDGQPDYGVSVNPAKSLVNFEVTINGTVLPRLQDSIWFPYCGNLINTRTLEIKRNFAAMVQGHPGDSVTVEYNRAPGQALHRKLVASFQVVQSGAMLWDTQHNSPRTVLGGIYAGFVHVANKMYWYVRSLRRRSRASPALLVKTIHELIQSVISRIRSELRKRRDRSGEQQEHFECRIAPHQIYYVGAAAFRSVLSRRQTLFAAILRALEQMERQSRPKTNRERLYLRRVIQEENEFSGWTL